MNQKASNNKITVSAPGKLMLMGEHAVVYGHKSIVTAINQRLKVEAAIIDANENLIDAPQVKKFEFVNRAITNTQKYFGIKNVYYHIHTDCPFSGVYGFGSSSAVTAGIVYAITGLHSLKFTVEDIYRISYQTVLDVQKTGSGFDVAAAVFGGTFLYSRNLSDYQELDTGKNIPLITAYTGIKSNSVEIVNEIAAKKQKFPDKVDRIFEAIDMLVIQSRDAIENSDWIRLGKYFDFNQEYLRDLGVSSAEIENIILQAKNSGALGAKLSGAGKGDCVVILADPQRVKETNDNLKKSGIEVVDVSPHAQGVRIEL